MPAAGGGASPPPPGAGTAPGQPPFGSSPVSQPTPNRGNEAAGIAILANATRLLEFALPMLGAGSDPGKDVISALRLIAKHVTPGGSAGGVEQNALRSMMLNKQQQAQNPTLQALQAKQASMQPSQGASAPGAPSA